MANVIVVLAQGFEEIEAVTIVDVLRRARLVVQTVSLDERMVRGSHDIAVSADALWTEAAWDKVDAIILPGGMPGSAHLRDDARLRERLAEATEAGKLVAAICAAPIALQAAGVLRGKRATSYPGHEIPAAEYSEERVVVDGNLVTSRGPGTALEFALALVTKLVGHDVAAKLRGAMLVGSP